MTRHSDQVWDGVCVIRSRGERQRRPHKGAALGPEVGRGIQISSIARFKARLPNEHHRRDTSRGWSPIVERWSSEVLVLAVRSFRGPARGPRNSANAPGYWDDGHKQTPTRAHKHPHTVRFAIYGRRLQRMGAPIPPDIQATADRLCAVVFMLEALGCGLLHANSDKGTTTSDPRCLHTSTG